MVAGLSAKLPADVADQAAVRDGMLSVCQKLKEPRCRSWTNLDLLASGPFVRM